MTDPIDDTKPGPADPAAGGMPAGAHDAGTAAETGRPVNTVAPPESPLRADPARPSDSGWREPAWFPPLDRTRRRERRAGPVATVIGLIFIVAGTYYFLDRTLGIALPEIQWDTVWPIALIVLGGLILVRSLQRRA